MADKLDHNDFKEILEPNISPYVKNRITKYSFVHEELNKKDYLMCLEKIQAVLNDDITQAGEERQQQWDDGWRENLTSNSLLPGYFGKYDIVRWKQWFVSPISKNYEVNMLHLIVDWLADKYMRDASRICEFGCGTGHNLQHVRMVNPKATLIGLDWAKSSQEIITKYANNYDSNLFAKQFNFFDPDYDFDNIGDVVYTVAALEQVGENFVEFLYYLLYNKPKLCIHIEPIGELLDDKYVIDRLSLEYFKKRNYLSGFLTSLRDLEDLGMIEIIREQRTYVGSLFIEGYSVVVWKLNKSFYE